MKHSLKCLPLLLFVPFLLFPGCQNPNEITHELPSEITLTRAQLKDKIMGGWAGQVIGCTYGGPTEFKFNGTMIMDYVPIHWDSTQMLWWYQNSPGLYDDVYMDLTFVQVFEEEGLDAPATSHANAFANADYMLWHANQAARYNILNGIEPPQSGYWENNPHSEDIDFQIEADFAGLMSPGMVNAASEICDRVGHIMNYGDGWYGGVYVAAMYALSFVSSDVEFIVTEALKAIPKESLFYQTIEDVIGWYRQYPDDWKRTWFEMEKKWAEDYGCPDGVFKAFNIDAKINAAYIIIGMLYGGGDYGKTLDISTRCGQDSDCNPASAGGILGTILGYSNIPEYWKQGIDKVEDMDFRYTTISLNDVYEMGYNHAIEMIEKNNGTIEEDKVTIQVQMPEPVKLEVGFMDHYPVNFLDFGWGGKTLNEDNTECEFNFEGTGFIISGRSGMINHLVSEDYVLEVEVYLDDELMEVAKMPTNYTIRKHDVTWKYNIPKGKHHVKLVLKNPKKGYYVNMNRVLFYSDEPNQNPKF